MQPTVVDELTYVGVLREHAVDGCGRRFDEHAEPQRLMHKLLTVVQRLPGQTDPQVAAAAREALELARIDVGMP